MAALLPMSRLPIETFRNSSRHIHGIFPKDCAGHVRPARIVPAHGGAYRPTNIDRKALSRIAHAQSQADGGGLKSRIHTRVHWCQFRSLGHRQILGRSRIMAASLCRSYQMVNDRPDSLAALLD